DSRPRNCLTALLGHLPEIASWPGSSILAGCLSPREDAPGNADNCRRSKCQEIRADFCRSPLRGICDSTRLRKNTPSWPARDSAALIAIVHMYPIERQERAKIFFGRTGPPV